LIEAITQVLVYFAPRVEDFDYYSQHYMEIRNLSYGLGLYKSHTNEIFQLMDGFNNVHNILLENNAGLIFNAFAKYVIKYRRIKSKVRNNAHIQFSAFFQEVIYYHIGAVFRKEMDKYYNIDNYNVYLHEEYISNSGHYEIRVPRSSYDLMRLSNTNEQYGKVLKRNIPAMFLTSNFLFS